MNIIISGRNIQVTPALKDHVERRVGKLERFIQFSEAQVTLIVEKDRHRVEVTIPLNNYILRGEEETGDMYASVDMVIDKLERQVEKYKARISRKQSNETIREPEAVSSSTDEDDEPKIVRTKRFLMKPMVVEEAVLQMNLLGHSFFVFTSAETDQVNVVYKRKDGNYGLIEPEV